MTSGIPGKSNATSREPHKNCKSQMPQSSGGTESSKAAGPKNQTHKHKAGNTADNNPQVAHHGASVGTKPKRKRTTSMRNSDTFSTDPKAETENLSPITSSSVYPNLDKMDGSKKPTGKAKDVKDPSYLYELPDDQSRTIGQKLDNGTVERKGSVSPRGNNKHSMTLPRKSKYLSPASKSMEGPSSSTGGNTSTINCCSPRTPIGKFQCSKENVDLSSRSEDTTHKPGLSLASIPASNEASNGAAPVSRNTYRANQCSRESVEAISFSEPERPNHPSKAGARGNLDNGLDVAGDTRKSNSPTAENTSCYKNESHVTSWAIKTEPLDSSNNKGKELQEPENPTSVRNSAIAIENKPEISCCSTDSGDRKPREEQNEKKEIFVLATNKVEDVSNSSYDLRGNESGELELRGHKLPGYEFSEPETSVNELGKPGQVPGIYDGSLGVLGTEEEPEIDVWDTPVSQSVENESLSFLSMENYQKENLYVSQSHDNSPHPKVQESHFWQRCPAESDKVSSAECAERKRSNEGNNMRSSWDMESHLFCDNTFLFFEDDGGESDYTSWPVGSVFHSLKLKTRAEREAQLSHALGLKNPSSSENNTSAGLQQSSGDAVSEKLSLQEILFLEQLKTLSLRGPPSARNNISGSKSTFPRKPSSNQMGSPEIYFEKEYSLSEEERMHPQNASAGQVRRRNVEEEFSSQDIPEKEYSSYCPQQHYQLNGFTEREEPEMSSSGPLKSGLASALLKLLQKLNATPAQAKNIINLLQQQPQLVRVLLESQKGNKSFPSDPLLAKEGGNIENQRSSLEQDNQASSSMNFCLQKGSLGNQKTAGFNRMEIESKNSLGTRGDLSGRAPNFQYQNWNASQGMPVNKGQPTPFDSLPNECYSCQSPLEPDNTAFNQMNTHDQYVNYSDESKQLSPRYISNASQYMQGNSIMQAKQHAYAQMAQNQQRELLNKFFPPKTELSLSQLQGCKDSDFVGKYVPRQVIERHTQAPFPGSNLGTAGISNLPSEILGPPSVPLIDYEINRVNGAPPNLYQKHQRVMPKKAPHFLQSVQTHNPKETRQRGSGTSLKFPGNPLWQPYYGNSCMMSGTGVVGFPDTHTTIPLPDSRTSRGFLVSSRKDVNDVTAYKKHPGLMEDIEREIPNMNFQKQQIGYSHPASVTPRSSFNANAGVFVPGMEYSSFTQNYEDLSSSSPRVPTTLPTESTGALNFQHGRSSPHYLEFPSNPHDLSKIAPSITPGMIKRNNGSNQLF